MGNWAAALTWSKGVDQEGELPSWTLDGRESWRQYSHSQLRAGGVIKEED